MKTQDEKDYERLVRKLRTHVRGLRIMSENDLGMLTEDMARDFHSALYTLGHALVELQRDVLWPYEVDVDLAEFATPPAVRTTLLECRFFFDVDGDDDEKIWSGFDMGGEWNGFARVAVTRETLVQMREYYRSRCGVSHYDEIEAGGPTAGDGLFSLVGLCVGIVRGCAAITEADIIDAAQLSDLDAAVGKLQKIAGITDDDIAGVVLSAYGWADQEVDVRIAELARYVRVERAYQRED